MLYDPALLGCRFALGGITINGGTDANGCDWILTKEAGWFASPAIKTARVDKPAARGIFRGNEFRGGRVMTLAGSLSAPNVATLRNAQRQLFGLCPDPHLQYPLTVTEEDGSATYANVALDGEILTTPVSWRSVEFSIQLVAPDPRKFSTPPAHVPIFLASPGSGGVSYPVKYPVAYGTPGSTGSAVISNAGSADADPQFQFIGPLTNPSVMRADTGDVLTYNGSLTMFDVVTVDSATGAVLFDGINRRALLTANNWFTIPPYGSINVIFRSSGPTDTGIVTVTSANTFY